VSALAVAFAFFSLKTLFVSLLSVKGSFELPRAPLKEEETMTPFASFTHISLHCTTTCNQRNTFVEFI